jgi:hypothetical protein
VALDAGVLAFLISSSIARAPSGPTSAAICAMMWPCTASRPKTRPANAIVTTSSGAMEKMV